MKTLMIQGTSSHAGKSVLVAALLRCLRNSGVRCAPFKPQNMALNSFVTMDGYEIGRAQAMQAEAAGVLPVSDMNPVLLKPTTDSKAQVIVHGRPWKNMSAREYVDAKKQLKKVVAGSFERLNRDFDAVVVEGAGSPAEINLRKNDIANMGFARMFDIPVVIVGDIDRGGIYASFYGTYALLTRSERALLKGFVINKFRGDATLLKDANDYILRRTGLPVAGVIPYFTDIQISDEDGVSLSGPGLNRPGRHAADGQLLRVSIVKLPRISNFTDFEPLFLEEGVNAAYVSNPGEAEGSHLLVIPGSKNTIEDLLFLREKGFDRYLDSFVKRGGFLLGICGGYQMLGRTIEDPHGIESGLNRVNGLGFFETSTVIEQEKQLRQVNFDSYDGTLTAMRGYEIHMGLTDCGGATPLFRITGEGEAQYDGLADKSGRVLGTYMHGVLDNDNFRLWLLNRVREANGIEPVRETYNYLQYKDSAYDRLASLFERSVDMKLLRGLMGL